MKVKIITVGALTRSLPKGQEIIEGREFTVQEALDTLVSKHGKLIAEELYENGKIKKDLSILINGRNVLSIQDKYQTPLKDQDEIMITIYVTGG